MSRKGGIDRGFCFAYADLSDRRKFLRTLWLGPLLMLLLLPLPELFLDPGGGLPAPAVRWAWYGSLALMQLLFVAQLAFTSLRWRSDEGAGRLG